MKINDKPAAKDYRQLFWGIALVLAGVGVLLRNTQVMPRLAEFQSFSKSVVIIFYFIGIVLIVGGAKKIIHHFKKPPTDRSDTVERSSD